MPKDIGSNWDQLAIKNFEKDDPELIYEGVIKEQRRILSGYNPEAHHKVDKKKWIEAQDPKHFAISLSGEPLLYNKINDLISYIKSKNKTVFLVTNGQETEKIQDLVEPTQLYVSLSAPNEEIFLKTCRPSYSNAWARLQDSITLLSNFKCPTALRLTLVKGFNLLDPEGYAESILKSNCTYVEVKAAMFVGGSLFRMNFNNMPSYLDIRDFAKKISDLTGYYIIDEVLKSRVVLLSRLKKPVKINI
jgi:tRNA wybutosine-synthesizing protein 1